MSIIRKETNMIKATISNETKRNAFAKAGGRKIAGGIRVSKAAVRGLVISNYKTLATGICSDKEIKHDLNNVILFKKQKEVA